MRFTKPSLSPPPIGDNTNPPHHVLRLHIPRKQNGSVRALSSNLMGLYLVYPSSLHSGVLAIAMGTAIEHFRLLYPLCPHPIPDARILSDFSIPQLLSTFYPVNTTVLSLVSRHLPRCG